MGSRLVFSSLKGIKTRARGKQVKNILVIFATFNIITRLSLEENIKYCLQGIKHLLFTA